MVMSRSIINDLSDPALNHHLTGGYDFLSVSQIEMPVSNSRDTLNPQTEFAIGHHYEVLPICPTNGSGF